MSPAAIFEDWLKHDGAGLCCAYDNATAISSTVNRIVDFFTLIPPLLGNVMRF